MGNLYYSQLYRRLDKAVNRMRHARASFPLAERLMKSSVSLAQRALEIRRMGAGAAVGACSGIVQHQRRRMRVGATRSSHGARLVSRQSFSVITRLLSKFQSGETRPA
jgi:hypothetical protein